MRPNPPLASMQARRAAWTPASLPNDVELDLFDEHNDAGSGACDIWDGESSTPNATASGTERPTISTADANLLTEVLDFDGTNDTMVTPSITGGQNTLTYVIVCRLDVVPAGVAKIVEASDHSIFIEGGKLSVWANGATGQDYVAGNTTIAINTNYEFVVEIPFSTLGSAQIKSWVNRAAQTQTDIVATATNKTSASSTVRIGKWALAALQYFNGKMARISRYRGAFTAPDLASYGAYNQATHAVP